jgi:hypothetical protein
VLGEVYWQCEVGELNRVTDFVNGSDVLSREESPGEVRWGYSTPVGWPLLAQAFGLPLDGAGATAAGGGPAAASTSGGSKGCVTVAVWLFVIGFVLLFCMFGTCGSCASGGDDDDDSSSGVGTTSGSYRGGGVYSGGK